MLSEPVHGISDSVVCASGKILYAQSGQSLCLSIECSVTVGLLTGRRLGLLCLEGWGAVWVRLGLRVSGGHIVGLTMYIYVYNTTVYAL